MMEKDLSYFTIEAPTPREALEKMRYHFTSANGTLYEGCAGCGRSRVEGHSSDCEIAAVLARIAALAGER